jgi:hypothetical protein
LAGQTSDKDTTSLPVSGLVPGARYYFVVRTYSAPAALQQNGIESDSSAEVSVVVVPAQVQVQTPNGGESFWHGSQATIRWDVSNYDGDLVIELWQDGAKLGTIATVAAAAKAYDWTVGSYQGGDAVGTGFQICLHTPDGALLARVSLSPVTARR